MRDALFLAVCLPVRLAIASHPSALSRAAAFAIASRWASGVYANVTKGFFGGDVWWRELRVLHAGLWLAFAWTGKGGFLKSDALLGLTGWLFLKHRHDAPPHPPRYHPTLAPSTT